jgi:hypothetical protein
MNLHKISKILFLYYYYYYYYIYLFTESKQTNINTRYVLEPLELNICKYEGRTI